MVRSPNSIIPNRKTRNIKPFELGNNQINKLFRKVIEVLLKREYYEGTQYGKYYNSFREDGRSSIYVDQVEIEERLQSQFIYPDESITKFLVGYMGVGKTTLIRNLFHVFGRDIVEYDNNLIIYVSYFATHKSIGRIGRMKSEEEIEAEKDVAERLLLSGIDMAVTFLSGNPESETKIYSYDRKQSYDDEFYISFARFIEDNNANMSHYMEDIPEVNDELKNGDYYKNLLNHIYEEDRVDYQLSLLKYALEKSNRKYDNIYLIIDDLETLTIDAIIDVIALLMQTQKCMQGQKVGKFNFKQLVSMRNHTCRSIQLDRMADALRFNSESIIENIIYKDQMPYLSAIISARYNSIKDNEEFDDKEIYKIVKDDLEYLLNKLYGQYDAMLLNLTHYNLYNALHLLLRILTNRQFLGKNEVYIDGAFNFNREIYPLENPSIRSDYPKNEDVFFALAYGENSIYCDANNYYLTNILHYHEDEGRDTELLGIYVIQYMIKNNYLISVIDAPIVNDREQERKKRDWHLAEKTKGHKKAKDQKCILSYDTLQTIQGEVLTKRMTSFYGRASVEEYDRIMKGYDAIIAHLYEGGVLLQSIEHPIVEDSPEIKRQYSPKIELYLSLRGQQLYRMLGANSLLMQVYRDDIDTDLEDNDIPTLKLPKWKRIDYCIRYINNLFIREKRLFDMITNLDLYFEKMGYELAVVVLMRGIRESIVTYFERDHYNKTNITRSYNTLAKEINHFLDDLERGICNNKRQKIHRVGMINEP